MPITHSLVQKEPGRSWLPCRQWGRGREEWAHPGLGARLSWGRPGWGEVTLGEHPRTPSSGPPGRGWEPSARAASRAGADLAPLRRAARSPRQRALGQTTPGPGSALTTRPSSGKGAAPPLPPSGTAEGSCLPQGTVVPTPLKPGRRPGRGG